MPTKRTIAKHRPVTAYHEAGHAVVAYFEDIPVKYATIRPREEEDGGQSFGHVQYGRIPKWVNQEFGTEPRQLDFLVRLLTAGYAGPIAEKKFNGRAYHRYASGDYNHAVDRAFLFCGTGEEASACLQWVYQRAVSRVDCWWEQIQVVAEALLRQETLTSDEMWAAIRATGPGRLSGAETP